MRCQILGLAGLLGASSLGCAVGEGGPEVGPDAGSHDPGQAPIEWLRIGGAGQSEVAALSHDGRRIAFSSTAADLVDGDQNEWWDAFVLDYDTRSIWRVSVSGTGAEADGPGAQAPHPTYATSISADGLWVTFASGAGNLVPDDDNGMPDLFAHELTTGETSRVNLATGGGESDREEMPWGVLSGDGRLVAFASHATTLGGDPSCAAVYLRDRQSGETIPLTAGAGTQSCMSDQVGSLALSGAGDVVAYRAEDGAAVGFAGGIFLSDRSGASGELASARRDGQPANGRSGEPVLSGDGRFVAFWSDASNLVAGDDNGDSDIFVRDRESGGVERVSVATGGAQSRGDCWSPSISADGRLVAFASSAPDLVAGDQNGVADVFVHDRRTGATVRVSAPPAGGESDGPSDGVVLSGDGRVLAFTSEAENLLPGSGPGTRNVFVAPNPLAF
jgi:Tol biopolymer transport system component